MKKIFSNIRTMAALLMAGAAFAACSSSDDIIENQQPANNGKQAYTLTINASKDGAATRALTVDNGAIVASWETTDVIHVTKGGTEIGTLSPTDISGLTATFTGTISGDAQIAVSDVLTLTYHPVADFATQNGTLSGSANSAENYDMAVATLTISAITGNTITVSESQANFVNQTAVVVLSPYNSSWSQYHGLASLIVSVTIDVPSVGTVTEHLGPFTLSGDLPYYFALPSQASLAKTLAAKYSLAEDVVSALLASATITFTGHQSGDDTYDREYLTCSKTGYKFAAGKYYKLDESNFSMTFLYKRAAAGKEVYVLNADVSWSNTVTYAVNREIGWRIVGDDVYCGDLQLYVEVGPGPLGPDPWEGFVKATDDFIPFGATYSLVTPAPAPSYDNTLNINTYDPELNNWENVTVPTGEHWLITGTGEATTNVITIANNATVTLSGVNITAYGRSITCVGNATIILADGTTNNLYSAEGEYGAAGIEMNGGSGTSLTIQGNTGVLNITSGQGPAIGAGYGHAGCAINIEGGIINATSTDGPGIGAAYTTACGNITISGGTVAATGGYGCPGIGGASSANCGAITITSNVTSVTATKGSEAPYSIGASSSGSCGTVTIEDPSKVTQN